jgi:hypothetical protein
MRIGILTYHWATNYGAVMQCYALQTYLESQGHIVNVINYKPRRYDDSLYAFFKYKKYKHLRTYLKHFFENRKRERALSQFRRKNLKCTKRVYSHVDIPQILVGYDAIISGSDQVLNLGFLLHGEGENIITPTYYLGFPFKGRKIGYALSFGSATCPHHELLIASKYIDNFNHISVREETGVGNLEIMGRFDSVVVPDPTLLMSQSFYSQLLGESILGLDGLYVYSFFIRNISERKQKITQQVVGRNILWNNEDGDFSIQGWLTKIKNAEYVITDSFHCMVMCLKLHIPFLVVTELKGNVGMNDRFYTLLEKMSLEIVIVYKDDVECFHDVSNIFFDWKRVDEVLKDYSIVGETFLNTALL